MDKLNGNIVTFAHHECGLITGECRRPEKLDSGSYDPETWLPGKPAQMPPFDTWFIVQNNAGDFCGFDTQVVRVCKS